VSRLGPTDKSAAGSRLSSPPPPDVSPDVGPRLANGVSGDDSEAAERKSGRPSATAKKYSEPRKKMELRQYLEPAVSKTSSTSVEENLISSFNLSNISQLSSQSQPGHWTPTPPFQSSYQNEVNFFQDVPNNNKDDAMLETLRKRSTCSMTTSATAEEHQHHQQTRTKGRKRWGLNMAVKSGSLKSIKSEAGSNKSGENNSDTRQSSGRGMGAMMLANLHGLTRSRPDILNESYNTAFQAPTKIPKDEIGAFLQAKLSEGEVVREFEKIPKKKVSSCNTNVALVSDNVNRNRFKDVVPYDENRVKITNDKDNKFGYVNASHISATVGDQQRFYIAAQGPMATTVHHFWSMIQECDVHLVVMLTDVSGSSKTSACIPYWPQNDGSSLEIGDFTITKKFSSSSNNSSYSTSTLTLTHVPTRRTRTVWHLQYSSWHDHGCPDDVHTFLQFLEELSALRRHTVSEVAAGKNRNTPVLVHCSAGVGRTGVTILCDILLYCLDHNIDIDIPKVLTHLRQQRMMMVQTVSQYKFVHTVLINYLGQSRLI